MQKKRRYIFTGFILIILILTILPTNMTGTLSNVIRNIGTKFFYIDWSDPPRWVWDIHWMRSLAHIPLYFLLGITAAVWKKGWKAIPICAMVALLDETIKIFLSTREFEAIDLLYDAVGFLLGIGTMALTRWIYSKRKN